MAQKMLYRETRSNNQFEQSAQQRRCRVPSSLRSSALAQLERTMTSNVKKGKGRKMLRMEIQIVRQTTRRTHGLAIPRAHRLRRADRRDGFQPRPGP
jgi:hypothetical protein